MKQSKSYRKRAIFALLTTAIIWGFAPPIIKYSLQFITPVTFLFFRFLIVSLILVVPLSSRIKKIKPRSFSKYFILGFLGTPLALFLLFTGLSRTSAIEASVIYAISPVLVVLGGALYLREKVTKKESYGVLLALTGTGITVLQPLLAKNGSLGHDLFGNVLVFMGAIVWALFTIFTKKAKLDPFILTASSFVVGAIIFLPLFLSQGNISLPPASLPGILYMAIFGSVIAYFTYLYGVSKIEASEACLFTYLQPLFTLPIAVIFLHETISPPFILGATLIAAGVYISEKR